MRSSAAAKARLDLDRFLPYRLSVLSNRVSSAIARQYSDRFGLSIPEWRVMAVLGGSPGLSARDVAERTAMDKVQVSRALESLVRARPSRAAPTRKTAGSSASRSRDKAARSTTRSCRWRCISKKYSSRR